MEINDLIVERNFLAKQESAGNISESDKIRLTVLRRVLTTPPKLFFVLPRVEKFSEL